MQLVVYCIAITHILKSKSFHCPLYCFHFPQANEAIEQLKDKVDTLIVVSNDKLLQIVPTNTPVTDAFLVADDILRQGVVGISEIIIKPGLVNVDFADIRTVMSSAG